MIHLQRRRQCEDEAEKALKVLALRAGVVLSQAQSAGAHRELEEARNIFSPRGSGKIIVLPTPGFWLTITGFRLLASRL